MFETTYKNVVKTFVERRRLYEPCNIAVGVI
jgi:hypothetical protein